MSGGILFHRQDHSARDRSGSDLTTNYSPETIRHQVGLFRRIVGKWQHELVNFAANNVRFADLRVRSLDGWPARSLVSCGNLLELVREARNPSTFGTDPRARPPEPKYVRDGSPSTVAGTESAPEGLVRRTEVIRNG